MGSIIANKAIGIKSTTAASDTHWENIHYQQIHKWTKCNKNQWHKYQHTVYDIDTVSTYQHT